LHNKESCGLDIKLAITKDSKAFARCLQNVLQKKACHKKIPSGLSLVRDNDESTTATRRVSTDSYLRC